MPILKGNQAIQAGALLYHFGKEWGKLSKVIVITTILLTNNMNTHTTTSRKIPVFRAVTSGWKGAVRISC